MGSGLGLNIVYNLVSDVLCGNVQITSVLGQGTCISIRIRVLFSRLRSCSAPFDYICRNILLSSPLANPRLIAPSIRLHFFLEHSPSSRQNELCQ